jgi:NADP-reducing hydrogenase subunit HndB
VAKLRPDDLAKIRDRMAKAMSLREGEARAKVTVHMGTCGIAAGARKIMSALMSELEGREEKDIILTTSGCAGLCSREPMITVELKGEAPVKYDHVLAGTVVKEYALAVGSEQVG